MSSGVCENLPEVVTEPCEVENRSAGLDVGQSATQKVSAPGRWPLFWTDQERGPGEQVHLPQGAGRRPWAAHGRVGQVRRVSRMAVWAGYGIRKVQQVRVLVGEWSVGMWQLSEDHLCRCS